MITYPVPFIEAVHFTPANRGRASAPGLPDPLTVDLIVLHSAEDPEKPNAARAVAGPNWFGRMCADPTCSAHPGRAEFDRPGPKSSATYCVDDREVIQCVREHDVAWAAPGANRNGIHIEHAGRASQSANEWGDEFSMAMLHLSIELCTTVCKTWGLPAVFVRADEIIGQPERDVRTGVTHAVPGRGITTHAEISLAFATPGGHTDPGPNFPTSWYVDRVAALLSGG